MEKVHRSRSSLITGVSARCLTQKSIFNYVLATLLLGTCQRIEFSYALITDMHSPKTLISTRTRPCTTRHFNPFQNEVRDPLFLLDSYGPVGISKHRSSLSEKTAMWSSSKTSILSAKPSDPIEFDPKTAVMLVGAQASLAVIAVAASMILNTPSTGAFGTAFDLTDLDAVATGVEKTVPLLTIAGFFEVVEWAYDKYGPAEEDENSIIASFKKVTEATQTSVLSFLGSERKLFPEAFITSVGLGLAAGVGEELLFRGVLQSAITENIGVGPIPSLFLTSIIFGLLHFATPLYAFLAFLASLYFGSMYMDPNVDNLIIPMVCHTLYDVVALMYAHYAVTGLTDTQRARLLGNN
uniref:CAAX prenyl protease 2/Lysostaphin resistance protein A-like domain-containing protein n=1 Tax=Corethron hystrix TaxID=216773 RepID=A0A7S1B4M4_9STRA|mmetsp:Transcript_1232/g.2495  ORF Transcript_1232/g.2495 Transcript_1232/m.2495 type:complete len:353 (+) Transcript_1232:282-1340(+)